MAGPLARPSIKSLLCLLENGQCVEHDFTCMHAPLPACDDTRFVAAIAGRRLLVAVTPSNSRGPAGLDDTIELFFDPYADGVGYVQFVFSSQGEPVVNHFMPCAQARSTRFTWPGLLKYQVVRHQMIGVVGETDPTWTLVAEFAADDIFRAGNMCGFNVCRGGAGAAENTSWNLCSGAGFLDASSFGRLYRGKGPRVIQVEQADLTGSTLRLKGQAAGKGPFSIELADPLDRRVRREVHLKDDHARQGQWQAALTLPSPVRNGLHRIYLHDASQAAEPSLLSLTRQTPQARKRFSLGMVLDHPDDLMNHHFTPRILDEQIRNLASWGIGRLYWIDYPGADEAPSYWKVNGHLNVARRTAKACGPLLPRVVRTCKKHQMQCLGILKIFDQAYNWKVFDEPAPDRVSQDDGRFGAAFPPVLDAPDAVMSAHPDWWPEVDTHVRKLRLISVEPICNVKPQQVSLWVSKDNRRYKRVNSSHAVRCLTQRRSHRRWTPAGAVDAQGSRQVHVLEIDGLNLHSPFAAFRVDAPGFCCVNQRFDLLEAVDDQGHIVTCRLGWSGDVSSGFSCVAPWSGWANHNQRQLRHSMLSHGQAYGLMFKPPWQLNQALEPASPKARAAWMARIHRMLEAGVDGVDLRLLCHHLSCDDWSVYAFNRDVRQQFHAAYGREAESTDEDLLRIQTLRGRGLTQLLHEAREATSRCGKKLIVHIEPGAELPESMNQRMAMTIPWRQWIEQNLVDELAIKFWSAHSRFIHEQLLPLAKRHGVAVHAIDSNVSLRTPRAIERAVRLVNDASDCGLDGLVFYENAGYQRMNETGRTMRVGHAGHAIRAAADSL